MLKKNILSLFILILSFNIHAQDIARVRNYIDTLTSPCMHGRGYVQNGEKIAATFIENEFGKIGLTSFNPDTTVPHPYFQYFSHSINTFPGKVSLKVNKNSLVTGKDFILDPSSGPGKNTLKIFRLDTLLYSDTLLQQKFAKLNTSKLCLAYRAIDQKKVDNLPPLIKQKINNAPCKITIAKKLTASYAPYQLPVTFFTIKEDCFPNAAKKISYEVEAKLIDSYKTQNVIGFIKGKLKPDSFIVISAHYDHLGRMGKEVYFPGANDNASGTSMMLELAQYYSKNIPDYSIVFIAFGSEEAGLIGSKFYTENPLFPLSRIKFLINLDLLGTGEEGITVVNATKFPEAFDLLHAINEEKKYLSAVKKRGPAANSDHYFFTVKGVPSFFIYTMGGIAAYHDIYDRPETLPLTKFQQVFSLLKDFISGLK